MAIAGVMEKSSLDEVMKTFGGTYAKEIIQDTNTHAGSWALMHVIEEAGVSAITDLALKEGTYVGLTLPVGAVFGGHFTSVTLSAGAVIMYEGIP